MSPSQEFLDFNIFELEEFSPKQWKHFNEKRFSTLRSWISHNFLLSPLHYSITMSRNTFHGNKSGELVSLLRRQKLVKFSLKCAIKWGNKFYLRMSLGWSDRGALARSGILRLAAGWSRAPRTPRLRVSRGSGMTKGERMLIITREDHRDQHKLKPESSTSPPRALFTPRL